MSLFRFLPHLLVLCASSAHAVSPEFDWVAAGGGAKSDKTRAVAADSQGNVFLAGETSEEGTFGDAKRPTLGSTDFFLAKTSPEGKFLWVRSLGGSLVDRGYGVVADDKGNAYVTGHFQSTDAQALGKALPNAGDYDIFVAKYDAGGDLLWIRTAGGKGYDYGHGIALDGKGDVVVAGSVAGEGKFGDALANAGSTARAVFWAKYAPDGSLKWVKTTSGGFSGSGHGIVVDGQDNLYIGGSGGGSGKAGAVELSTKGGQAAVVIKTSPDGEPVWASLVQGTPSAGFHELTVNAAGEATGVGMFKGALTVNGEAFQTGGDKDNDGFVVHFAADGKPVWTRILQGPGVDYCLGAAHGGDGRIYVTGEFSATAQFAGQTLVSQGATDIYTAAFDGRGHLEWLLPNGGSKGDNAYTLLWRPGALILGGACAAPAEFGKKMMTSPAGAEAYSAKLRLPEAASQAKARQNP
ncbi:MAG TPA: SBBP repeat-containing protein [Prosthecobacter sp.]